MKISAIGERSVLCEGRKRLFMRDHHERVGIVEPWNMVPRPDVMFFTAYSQIVAKSISMYLREIKILVAGSIIVLGLNIYSLFNIFSH